MSSSYIDLAQNRRNFGINNSSILAPITKLKSFFKKAILSKDFDISRIGYKDTRSYFSIIIDGMVSKWICRLYFKESVKFVVIGYDENRKEIRYDIESLDDLFGLSDKLTTRTKQLLG